MEYDLVFEGGGAKGMVFVGAMQEFEARGHTYKRLLGTSAGAITATMLAAGYSAQEMLEALGEKENGVSVFTRFMAQPGPFEKKRVLESVTFQFLRELDIPFIPDFIEKKLDDVLASWLCTNPKLASTYSLAELGGWYSADHFITWMKRRLDTGLDRQGQPRRYSGMNLLAFYNATHYDLSLVASDTTGGQMLVLNHRTAPDLSLVWAVRMSMSIPLLWQEVIWQPEWGKYLGREMVGHAIVDGGILSNFPLELFVSKNEYIQSLMGQEAGQRVLGMVIDESLAVAGTPVELVAAPRVTLSQAPLLKRISNLVNTTLSAKDKLVSQALESRVARMPARGYGTVEFDMTDERRTLLVQAGCDAMKTYLDKPVELDELGNISYGMGDEEMPLTEEQEKIQREADQVALRIFQ